MPDRTEFTIVFDGIDLPDDAREAIESAITRAVASEVARLNLAGPPVERPLVGLPGGPAGRMYVPAGEA